MNETVVMDTFVPETVETVQIVVDRPFLTTRFEEYTVVEGFQLLNFVLLLCCLFLALLRR